MHARSTLLVCTLVTASTALAQNQWDKTYPLSGRPALQVEADNASVQVHSCGECRAVHIHVDAGNQDLSQYKLEESGGGNNVRLHLQRKAEHSFFSSHRGGSPRISVELPGTADVKVDSGNGDLRMADLQGDLRVHTGNGAAIVEHSTGSLRVDSGNGEVTVRDSGGTLTASTGNGVVRADGRFTQVEAHTGNGKLDITFASGSKLNTGSHLTSGNGSIVLRLPRDLQADLQLSTGDGSVRCDLPLTGNSSGDRDRNNLKGTLNGGGPLLHVNTGDGSVSVSGL